jgi:hypothetical protein
VPPPPSKIIKEVVKDTRDFSKVKEMEVFKPTTEEFKEPIRYIEKLYKEGAWKYGCIKIIPPEDFKPPFSFDTDSNVKLPFRSQILQNLAKGKVISLLIL